MDGKEGRPDVGAACAMAMSWSSSGPTVDHILRAIVNELKKTMEVYPIIIPIPTDQAIWLSVADASMANVEQKSQADCESNLGQRSPCYGRRAGRDVA